MTDFIGTLHRLIGDPDISINRDVLSEIIDRSKSYVDSRLQGQARFTEDEVLQITKYGVRNDIEELSGAVTPSNKHISNISVNPKLLNGTSRDECNNILKYVSIISEIEMDEREGDRNDLVHYVKAIIQQSQRMLAEFRQYHNFRDYQIRELKDQAGIA